MKIMTCSLIIALTILLSSCGIMTVTTDLGIRIGTTFQELVSKGEVSAEQSIKAWPFISGQIKGLLSSNYDLKVSVIAKHIIQRLDDLAQKETLTLEDKGFILSSFVRLEAIMITDTWDEYGADLLSLFQKAVGM